MKRITRIWAVRLGVMVLALGAMPAQHTFSQSEIEDGRRLYESNCTRCHGPEGNLVDRVDLGHGKFLRASSDEDVIRVIRSGIATAGMPPGNYSDSQAETIVAYLRAMSGSTDVNRPQGDAAKGKALFERKGGCLNCHRVNGKGSRTGPDLSDIGMLRRFAVQLESSLLEPDAEVLPQNRSVRLVTQDGAIVQGRLLNQDTFSVQVLDSSEHLVSLLRSNLREFTFIEKSPMPSYRDKLSSQEIADVVSYLVSLKGL